MAPQAGVSLTDQNLNFGAMNMVPGRAFALGANAASAKARVSKHWVQVQGRQLLLEEVPVNAILDGLAALPLTAMNSGSNKHAHMASKELKLPPKRLAQTTSKTMLIAKADLPAQGFVMDYQTTIGNLTNYTFKADTTYYVTGNAFLYGTTTIEGNTVVKYAVPGPVIEISGAVNCQTAPYRPALFTSVNDNSAGEALGSGTPAIDHSVNCYYLYFYNISQINLQHLRMCYSYCPLTIDTGSLNLSDVQFIHNDYPMYLVYVPHANVFNALMEDVEVVAFEGFSAAINVKHLTLDQCVQLGENDYSTTLALTNSLIVGTASMGDIPYATNYVARLSTNSNVFQTVGGGHYYLAANSIYRNIGTTNIESSVLADIGTKTTYPPVSYTNVTFTLAANFSPQAQRDTDTPDLGYHYDPMDYVFGGCIANSNFTFTAGTAVGWFRTSSGWSYAGYGIDMKSNVVVQFTGTVTAPTYWVRLNTVQEQDYTAGYGQAGIESQTATGIPIVSGNFLRCSALAGELRSYFSDDFGYIHAIMVNSEFWGGSLDGYGDILYYTNCLMQRVDMELWNGNTTGNLTLRNCTFFGGTFSMQRTSGGALPVSVRDCAFDCTNILTGDSYGSNSSVSDYDYNAYTNSTDPFSIGGTHDVHVSGSFNWQSSWFGNYYQATNSVLTNKGDVFAGQIGLYHFTTQTNQMPETNSIVDIGYHYVATDAYGNPLATLWYGIPDYLADTNGELATWELNYFGHLGLDPNGDFDGDGTNNITAYKNGTDPNKINFSFTVATQYSSNNVVSGVVTVLSGTPSSIAMLIDSTNFSSATWTAYTSSNITVNLGSTQGSHDVWIGLRGLPTYAQQTWQETAIVLDSTAVTITITNPVNNVSLNSSRVDVSGTFTAGAVQQITVNGVPAFIQGSRFEAINVPLAGGANAISAIVTDLNGYTNVSSINITGLTNTDGSMNNPVQLQATPVAGFVPLPVTFVSQANVPGTIQQVLYDYNGDDISDFVTNSAGSIIYSYATNGVYFPIVTIQTTAGRFSSIGGWNAVILDPTNQPVQINVQVQPTTTTFASIANPVDLKWSGNNLYVLSGSTATITEFATNGTTVRSLSGIGTSPSGLDVDSAGNVYVAVTSSNQVWKFFPTNSSFQADTNFGVGGCIGLTNGTSGSGTSAFNAPFDVAVSPDGSQISVSDSGNNRIQQFLATNGVFVAGFGTNGSAIGQFSTPKGLTYDSIGNLYVVDSGNNRVALAQGTIVNEVTGAYGTALGQFNGPISINISQRGVYVADSGNNRIQSFIPSVPFDASSSSIRFAMASFNQPAAVAAIQTLTNEMFYVADTGNNRVVLCTLTNNNLNAFQQVWNNMTSHVAGGDINGAISFFSVASQDDYRQSFLSIGTVNTSSVLNQIGTLTPSYIDDAGAEFYFTNTIGGQTITFPVEFDLENGLWKIVEF